MKFVKKSVFSVVTVSVVAACLLTTASAAQGLTESSSTIDIPPTAPIARIITSNNTAAATPVHSYSADSNTLLTTTVLPANAGVAPVLNTTADENTYVTILSDIKSTLFSEETLLGLQKEVGQDIADFAVQFNGYRYVYGEESPEMGFDCSGLAYYVYGEFGVELPRTAHLQFEEGTEVTKDVLNPGDLVFFNTDGSGTVSHVGIYLGDGNFIHAATSATGVKINSLNDDYWNSTFLGAKRIISENDAVQMLYHAN